MNRKFALVKFRIDILDKRNLKNSTAINNAWHDFVKYLHYKNEITDKQLQNWLNINYAKYDKCKQPSISNLKDWTYVVNYEPNRSMCSGECDDYCRCTTVNPVVDQVHYDSVYKEITNNLDKNSIKGYCIDRAIRKIVTINSFDCFGVRGYYGEESCIQLSESTGNKLYPFLNNILAVSNSEAIESILTLEYGYVLPEIKNQKWCIESVYVEMITVPYVKIDQEIVNSYTGDEMILCQRLESRYRLIDGNHRFAAAMKNNKKKVNIITTV